ncbi:MAG TPA: ABC transporter permease, partial [Pirellulaceae bacterium]
MVLEHPILETGPWLAMQLPVLGIVLLLLIALGLMTAFVVSVQRNGPASAAHAVARDVALGWRDLIDFSLRRCLAIARLAIKEALRSYVFVVLVVFALVLLFAGWFFSDEMEYPTRWYVSFVVKLAGFLSVLMSIFLSAFSLPNDIKHKTIHTVVTKPVRAWEIVLGRIVGFAAIGTVLLAAMGLMGYIWVVRAVSHGHVARSEDVQWDADTKVFRGKTSLVQGHRHEFSVPATGGQSMDVKGHYHEIKVDEGKKAYSVGPARGALQAQVPVYVPQIGGLRFLDRSGRLAAKGINVGKEWEYRGYIEGGTQCAAIFRFTGLNSREFPTALPLEMSIRVFR